MPSQYCPLLSNVLRDGLRCYKHSLGEERFVPQEVHNPDGKEGRGDRSEDCGGVEPEARELLLKTVECGTSKSQSRKAE